MGLFTKILNALSPRQTAESNPEVWQRVASEEDIEFILSASNSRPQIVFKHSSSCGISFFAKRSLDTPDLLENKEVDLYLIDVIRERATSLAFAEKMGIRHESPQIFVIKDGELTWHGSHNSVNAGNVLKNI